MEIGEGRLSTMHYKQIDTGMVLVNRERAIIPPGWGQDTAAVIVK